MKRALLCITTLPTLYSTKPCNNAAVSTLSSPFGNEQQVVSDKLKDAK